MEPKVGNTLLQIENEYEPGDILVVYSELHKEDYYFLIEGDRKYDMGMGFVYPYRCLNENKTGWGNFQYPGTRKVA